MTLTKLVNGVRRDLTPEEERSTRAEWAANTQEREDYERDYAYLDRRRAAYPSKTTETEAVHACFKKLQDDGEILDPLTAEWVADIDAIYNANPPPA